MKKLLCMFVFICLFSILYAEEFKIGAGLDAGVMLDFYTASNETYDMTVNINHTMLLIGACLDATYIRLALNYAMNISQSGSLEVGGDSIEAEFPDGYSLTYLNINLLGKYPINLGGVLLWPAVGVRYAMCLGYDINGDGENDLDETTDMNDIFILAGVGADIKAGPLVISPSVIFGYNLTPVQVKDYEVPENESYTNFNIQVGVSIIYIFM